MDKKEKNGYRQSLGRWGEEIAEKFLTDQGLILVERNFRSPDGEIDLILTDKDQLVMVEVKSRKDTEFGLPEDAVTEEKIEHLVAAADWFLQKNPDFSDNWRIDIVSIIGTPFSGEPVIDWFENVA